MGGSRRAGRVVASWVVILGTLAIAAVWAKPPASAEPEAVSAGNVQRGGELFQRWCAVCHGTDGGGTSAGPPLLDTSLAYNDLVMRTGRMPFAAPTQGVRERDFSEQEREDTLAYLDQVLGLSGVVDEPGSGDAGRGQEVYVTHCAQCHGAVGAGGISGAGTLNPAVRGLDPLTIAQATRIGPFQMPPFDEVALDDEEMADVVAFLHVEVPRSPIGWEEFDRVSAGVLALALGVGVVLLCVWTGRPVRMPDTPGTAVDDAAGPDPPVSGRADPPSTQEAR